MSIFGSRHHNFLGAIAIAACTMGVFTPLAGAANAATYITDPRPALWRIAIDDATVFIFGSYHVLPEDLKWMTERLRSAMSTSRVFVFEVELTREPVAEAQAFIDEFGYLPEGQTLSMMLTPSAVVSLQQLIDGLPLDPSELNRLRPWLAQLTVISTARREQNFSVAYGADMQIMVYAAEHRRRTRYLETMRQQLELFAKAGRENAVENFEGLVERLLHAPRDIEGAINTWLSGNAEAIGERLSLAMENDPEAKKILLDDRNAAWAQGIDAMLREGGRYFVTVGVGHLGGPGNVLDLLCARGWAVVRLQTDTGRANRACPQDPPV